MDTISIISIICINKKSFIKFKTLKKIDIVDTFPADAWSNYTSIQWSTCNSNKIRNFIVSFYFRPFRSKHHPDSFVFMITKTSHFKFVILYNITRKLKIMLSGLGRDLNGKMGTKWNQ